MTNNSAPTSPANWIQLANPPRVDEAVFIGVAWGGVALSGLFLAARGYVRVAAFGKLYWDDAFALAAWLMFVGSTAIWQQVKDYLYADLFVDAGLLDPPPADFEADTTTYLHASAAVQALFYSSLWFVKFSLLIFFRRLGSKVRSQAVLWWCVSAAVAASWVVALAIVPWDCITRDFAYISRASHCPPPWLLADDGAKTCTTAPATDRLRAVLTANTCFDVATDLLIMLVPISLLWKVRISLCQKLALLAIFSLTVVVIVFSVVRVAASTSYSFQFDQSWLYLWSSIEQAASIIVASLASFRVLFTCAEPSARHRPAAYGSATGGVRTWLPTRERAAAHRLLDRDPGLPVYKLPAHQIHVRSDISAVSAAKGEQAPAAGGWYWG